MNLYAYEHKKNDWQLLLLQNNCVVGLNKTGSLTVGSSVRKIFAYLVSPRGMNDSQILSMLTINNTDTIFKLNGISPFSLSVIRDKDEISYNGQRLYFTEEQVAKIELKQNDTVIFCPRCKDLIKKMTEVVRCPACGLLYHESQKEAKNCWSYDSRCICGHPTKFELSWKPPTIGPRINWRNRRGKNVKKK
ncbi:hypothetical protein AYK24_02780 [Thermoplasmatales archaeon SG8-52-4]|nr:MAG: hypothetical protein AYK24_02780 [Thermoplasmatales archaeon SG8-52-4]